MEESAGDKEEAEEDDLEEEPEDDHVLAGLLGICFGHEAATYDESRRVSINRQLFTELGKKMDAGGRNAPDNVEEIRYV